MHRELLGVKGTRVRLCGVGETEGSGGGTIFQGLRLTTETVDNHLGRRGCDNLRCLEYLNAGESLITKCSPVD
jgi:hypothetical protein